MAGVDPEPLKPAPRRGGSRPRIPGYRLENVIGRGSTGVVYRATQLAVDREVALKVLHPELAAKKRTVHRLQREARTTARLAHPHIVSAIDMGEVGGRWWYAMELVDGPSLALRLRQEGRIREREVLRLFIPLAEALVHTHEHGVVHRDIKPGNILIDRAGGARLADLGLAFADDDPLLTTTDGTLGTPHYISPEQARDPTAADIRSDIWSLGGTLFHAVCGRPPFAGDSTAEVLSGVLYAAIPDPTSYEPELSRGLVLVLRKCLSRDPAKRYQTPAELVDDLERVRERRRPHVRESSLEPLAGGLGSWVPWALGALVLVLMGAAGWLLSSRPWEVREQSVTYAPLERALMAVEADELSLAEQLAGLRALEPVPLEHDRRWRSALDGLTARLDEEFEQVRARTEEALSSALAQRRYDSARRVLRTTLAGELLERTGFSVAALPPGEFGAWAQRRRAEVEQALASELERLGQQLQSVLDADLGVQAASLRESGRYRSALAVYELSVDELARRASVELEGLPESERQALLAPFATLLDERRQVLERAWEEEDRSLLAELRELAMRVEAELERDELELRADRRLQTLFEGALARRGSSLEELPLVPEPRCLRDLERRGLELVDRQQLLERRPDEAAREVFVSLLAWLDDSPAQAAWESRQFGRAREIYDEWRAQARARWALGQEPWADALLDELELRSNEALRLEALLVRAATGVRALDRREWRLSVRGVHRSGRLYAGNDPLDQGFRFVVTEGVQEELELSLRELAPVEIERFCGFGEGGEEPTPEERLDLLLFRARCGDWAGVEQGLEQYALPEDALSARLRSDLERRLGRTRLDARRALDAEDALARALYESLTDEVVAAGRSEVLVLVERLLTEYAETPTVQAAEARLRELREDLRDPDAATLGDTFGIRFRPHRLDFPDQRRVSMAWNFPVFPGQETRWLLGDWAPVDVNGQVPPGVEQGARDLLDPSQAMRLLLREPLALEGNLVLEVDLRQEDALARLCVLSLGGFHVALTGPELPGIGRWGVHATRGSLDELLAELPSELERVPGELLSHGRAFTVRLSVQLDRGDAHLEILHPDETRARSVREWRNLPGRRPGTSTWLEVRAWEQLTVSEVRLSGRRVQR